MKECKEHNWSQEIPLLDSNPRAYVIRCLRCEKVERFSVGNKPDKLKQRTMGKNPFKDWKEKLAYIYKYYRRF